MLRYRTRITTPAEYRRCTKPIRAVHVHTRARRGLCTRVSIFRVRLAVACQQRAFHCFRMHIARAFSFVFSQHVSHICAQSHAMRSRACTRGVRPRLCSLGKCHAFCARVHSKQNFITRFIHKTRTQHASTRVMLGPGRHRLHAAFWPFCSFCSLSNVVGSVTGR